MRAIVKKYLYHVHKNKLDLRDLFSYIPFPKGRTIKKVMGGGDFRAAGNCFRNQIPCMIFFFFGHSMNII